MGVVYVINDGRWHEVPKDRYDKFQGEKFIGPPHWRLWLIMDMLVQYRYR